MEGKIYAIGDIHGCLDPLNRLLKKIGPDPERDRLVFLGDYINRGPDSRGVIERLIEVKKEHPLTVLLKGNHEVMFSDYLEGRHRELFLHAGGLETLNSYDINLFERTNDRKKIPEGHVQFLQELLPFWETNDYIFVHAGFEKGRHPAMQRSEWLYWADRKRFLRQRFPGGKKIVIFGHFAEDEPIVMEDKVGIDSGAVYGGKLTGLVLPDMRFVRA